LRSTHPWASRLARAARAAGAAPAPAHYLLGLALRQMGDLAGAEPAFKLALTQGGESLPAPARAELQEQLAQLAQQRGALEAAIAAWRAVLVLCPERTRSWNNLAMALRAQGANEAAEDALREALRRDPAYALAWVNLGELLSARFELGAAIDAYARAASLDARDFAARYQLGRCLVRLNRYTEAEQPLREALALAPEHTEAEALLAGVLGQVGAVEEARTLHCAMALRQPSNWHAQAAFRLALPDLYASAAHLREARAAYSAGLAELEGLVDAHQTRQGERFELHYANFALAYQGMDDLALQKRWAGLVETLARKTAAQLCAPLARRARPPGGRLRVGFVSSMLRAHTVGHYFGAWIKDLDAARFEVHYYNLFRGNDAVVEALSAAAARSQRLPSAVQAAAEMLRAAELDVLVFPDVGMDYIASVLPAFRLAPLQIAAWGHPVTTGFANIDAYLSCQDMEPAAGAAHYREPLVLLPGIGTRYALPFIPEAAVRADFGLPEGRRLYLNPQSLFKIHPDNDAVLCDLMIEDPEGVFLFFRDFSPTKTQLFADRVARAMRERGLAPKGQIKFLPRSDAVGFRAMLQMADVVLDTMHWSGGNTSLDALAAGVPLVTLPGEFMRGRQSAAMLRAMGIDELIARSGEEYRRLALSVAGDAGYRAVLRRRILAARGAVFDRSEAIEALARFLEERSSA
jgi:CRISPR-associated protein Csy1